MMIATVLIGVLQSNLGPSSSYTRSGAAQKKKHGDVTWSHKEKHEFFLVCYVETKVRLADPERFGYRP
jgi:hypothetical protein